MEDGEDGRRDNRDFIRTETVVVVRTAPTDGGGAGRVKQVELRGPGTWFSATQEPFLPPSRSSGPASDWGRRQTADIQPPLLSAPTGPAAPPGKGGGNLTGSFQIPEI